MFCAVCGWVRCSREDFYIRRPWSNGGGLCPVGKIGRLNERQIRQRNVQIFQPFFGSLCGVANEHSCLGVCVCVCRLPLFLKIITLLYQSSKCYNVRYLKAFSKNGNFSKFAIRVLCYHDDRNIYKLECSVPPQS